MSTSEITFCNLTTKLYFISQYITLTFNNMEKILYSLLVQAEGFLIVSCFIFLCCLVSNVYCFL